MTASTPEMSVAENGFAYVRGLWTLYLLGLRQHLHGKRWMVMTILFLIPAGLSLLVRCTARDVPPDVLEFVFVWMFIPQAILPLVALIYASGMIQDEQEEQTITYLLVRPLPKWAIYVMKLLSAITTSVVLTAIFTAVTFLVIYAHRVAPAGEILPAIAAAPERCEITIGIHALAVTAYCCLFGLLSLVTRRIMIVGILYMVVFEGLFANLSLGVRLITVIYYARLIAYRTLTFFRERSFGPDIASEAWRLDILHDPKLLEHPQRSTCLLILLGASLACAALAAVLCWKREFRVKTPAKD